MIVAVLCLAALDTVVLLAIHYKVREPMMVAFLAPQIPLAYLAARFAVARARRGDVPDWRGLFARPGRTALTVLGTVIGLAALVATLGLRYGCIDLVLTPDDRVVFLADGKVVDELRAPTADSVLERMAALQPPTPEA